METGEGGVVGYDSVPVRLFLNGYFTDTKTCREGQG